MVETIEGHDLVPRGNDVVHELLVGVVADVDFAESLHFDGCSNGA
jgi:hypothetical protein